MDEAGACPMYALSILFVNLYLSITRRHLAVFSTELLCSSQTRDLTHIIVG